MPQHVFLLPEVIQYVDDTLIITEANPTTLKRINRILEVYSDLTGLKINRAKSTLICTNSNPAKVSTGDRRHIIFQYLKLTNKILGSTIIGPKTSKGRRWTSNFLSYGGRVTLVKAVLLAMSLHYMQALRIPKGVIKHIDKMRRDFLWKGNSECKSINCLANWEIVCALKSNGYKWHL